MEPGCVISQRPYAARYYRGGGRGLSLKALKIISGESCTRVIRGVAGREGKKTRGEGGGSLRGLLNFDDR